MRSSSEALLSERSWVVFVTNNTSDDRLLDEVVSLSKLLKSNLIDSVLLAVFLVEGSFRDDFLGLGRTGDFKEVFRAERRDMFL